MKNLVFCLLLSVSLCSNAQNSFPLFAQKPTWRVDVESMTSYVIGYKYSSDTLFEGKIYSKSNNYLVRNEGKKTWIRVLGGYPIPKYSKEFLMYDFGLQKGDSIKVGPQNFGLPQPHDSTITIKVESIDSITVGNERRKRLKINYPRCGNYQRLSTMYWVEGIGSLSNPFYSAGCLCDGCEAGYSLICLKFDTIQVYLNPNYQDCNFTRVATQEVNSSDIKVYPNPFTNQITITNSENVQTAHLFATNGRLLKTINVAKSTTISLSELPTGFYWLTFIDAQGRLLSTRKVVKMNP